MVILQASKARVLPNFWVTRGADYAHHITMGLVWLEFAVAPLILIRLLNISTTTHIGVTVTILFGKVLIGHLSGARHPY